MNKRDELVAVTGDDELLFADGFDDAILGAGQQWGGKLIVVYSYNECVQILMDRDGMSCKDAIEYMDFNVVCAYVGERTPFFLMEGVD